MRTMSPLTIASDFNVGRSELGWPIASALAEMPSAPSSTNAARVERIMARPQRIRLEVVDNIWSAAVITLAFIS